MRQENEPDESEQPGRLIEPGVLRFQRLLPGPIERVWAYLADSDKRARWLAAGTLVPRVGAELALSFRHADLSSQAAAVPARYSAMADGCVTRHTLTRYEPPHVLGLTWGGGGEPLSEVTIELAAEGEQVRLVLTHRRLYGDSLVDVASGWHAHLAVLQAVLSGRKPSAFWVLHREAEHFYTAIEEQGHGH